MSTREEIEAALNGSIHRVQLHNEWVARNQPNCSPYWDDDAERLDSRKRLQDCARIANAYLAERQQRERDQQPPTREMFIRLGAIIAPPCGEIVLLGMFWGPHQPFPSMYIGMNEKTIDTIAKLSAACLLLGIDTEGIL